MCVPCISSSRRPLAIPSSTLLPKRQKNSGVKNSSCPSSSFDFQTLDNCSKTKSSGRLASHDYHDHSHDLESSFNNNIPATRGSAAPAFPIQLHEILETIEQEGNGHVISWQPHGRCFVIHRKREFINRVMPVFMKQSKFPSFRRQLNLYGFKRITAGPDRGGYYHELFLRGKPFLARHMQRQCIKGTGVRCRDNPEEEPNFYLLPNRQENTSVDPPSHTSSSSVFQKQDNNSCKTKSSHRLAHHDYHDHSHDSESSLDTTVPVPKVGVATIFPIQLHEMLGNIEQKCYGHVISWQPHGRCFVIHRKKEFINHVMPAFMKQSKFPSFRRQLNLYGFKRITTGPDRGGYYHELFLRGKPFLARHMQRQCIKGTGVRCRNNPEEEPNFYKMEPIAMVSSVVSDSEDDQKIKVSDHEKSAIADLVVSSTTSSSDDGLASFAGKKFYKLDDDENLEMNSMLDDNDEHLEMDSFLQYASEGEKKVPLVDDEDDANYEELLERMICQDNDDW